MAVKMVDLVLATSNANKMKEIRSIVPDCFNLISLSDAGVFSELPETTGTIPGNAAQKAEEVFRLTGKNSMADDTGLIVPALNGMPGVDSAFFAGLPRSDDRNMQKLLSMLEMEKDRSAYFLCVIALVMDGKTSLFEGRLDGTIALSPSGSNGFGYDPVFIPEGESRTLAMLEPSEKNRISHRKRALQNLTAALSRDLSGLDG
jgi:XTP/dITP diphosphohydrolase